MTSLNRPTPILSPIRVLPIPPNQPPPINLDDPYVEDTEYGYIQDALALDMDRDENYATPIDPDGQPDPVEWGRAIAQSIIEVMAGLRPPAHVVRVLAPPVYVAVARRHTSAVSRAAASGRAPATRRLVIRRVLACRPNERTAEVAVVVIDGNRVRAMALSLVAWRGSWRIQAIQIG